MDHSISSESFLLTREDKITDVIIVLAGDRGQRTEKGVELWMQGYAPYIMVSGATVYRTITIAELMKRHAMELGVPESAIIVEPLADSTYDNAVYSKKLVAQYGMHSAIRGDDFVMDAMQVLEIISRDEDGKHQFKADIKNAASLASEMVAFANSDGGKILIGVCNDGCIAGLTRTDMSRLNQLISNAASQMIHPPINPKTENVMLPDGLVMVVTILPGISKPYMDNSGVIWVKSGADKRRVTSREEVQRMYQTSGLLHGDEIPVNGIPFSDLDLDYFRNFFEKEYGESLVEQIIPIEKLLTNMNLGRDGVFNTAGALLFAKSPQYRLPVFIVKAVSYPGNDIHVSEYLDSQDMTGKLEEIYKNSLAFMKRNLLRVQDGQSVNSLGRLEIPSIVLEELLVNALIHRDYFISAPIRIFIFSDRIEIISPGHLPNNLTIENIKNGNSNIRNPILASFATKVLPYRGLGNGIRRAVKVYPQIDFVDDREGNLFTVIIKRM